jgi:hypothetical protein
MAYKIKYKFKNGTKEARTDQLGITTPNRKSFAVVGNMSRV